MRKRENPTRIFLHIPNEEREKKLRAIAVRGSGLCVALGVLIDLA